MSIFNQIVKGSGGGGAVINSLNVTPSTSSQTITASGGVDGYSPVNVSAVTSSIDANITAGNIKKNVTILGVTGTFEGGAAGKYQLLQRVKDDTNTEIGTVCGFQKDANNNEYAVVALDAQFRNASGAYLSEGVQVADLVAVYDQTLWETYTYTATSNCDKILAFANANGYTSTAVSHCRSKSFVIEGVTYYGQLPTIFELLDVFKNRTALNTKDTTAGSYPSLIVPNNTNTWSSSQSSSPSGWYVSNNGTVVQKNKTTSSFVLPVLELPNN